MSSFCNIKNPLSSFIKGSVRLNGSKSISNRMLIIDALCSDHIEMENLSNADDTVLLRKMLQSNAEILDAGAGGTTFRFMTAFLATRDGREVVLTGSERMQQRPVKILVDALRTLGADINYEKNEGFPPLRIKGHKLKGGKISLPADTSSQFITALLLIAPTLEEGLELELTGKIVSLPYIKMTLRIMEQFGIKTSFEKNIISVTSGKYQSHPFFIEGDWSAAAYFYSIAILAKQAEIELKGLTDQQIQGDAEIVQIAGLFGVETVWKGNSIILKKTGEFKRRMFKFDFLECPDLAQTVLSWCAALGIEVHCKGLQTLRIKETDRISALDKEFQKLGIASLLEKEPGNWILTSRGHKPDNSADMVDKEVPIINTYEDHRMAMSFAPLSLVVKELNIEEPEVVSKSYPLFWSDLKSLGFRLRFL